ncbi:MAG: hypothetical protein MI742_09275 [Desulfobacterales bacterium]|nr:hypothetical protein [Desulfobacterales bacterium]
MPIHTYLRLFFALFSFMVASHGAAEAYLLSTSQITQQMVKKLGRVKAVKLTETETFFSAASEGAAEPRVVEGELTLQRPDRFYDLLFEGEKRVETYGTVDDWFRVVDGKRVEGSAGPSESYIEPLQLRSRDLFRAALLKWNVDVETTSLGRHNGRIAWVVGAKAFQPEMADAPQFWVEKESFLPMRWILPTSSGATLEVWYHDWFKQGNASWPGRIEFYRNGFLFREIRMADVKRTKALADHRFDAERYPLKGAVENQTPLSAPPENPVEQPPSEGEKRLQELEEILSRDSLAF